MDDVTKEISYEFSGWVRNGGRWKPTECRARVKVRCQNEDVNGVYIRVQSPKWRNTKDWKILNNAHTTGHLLTSGSLWGLCFHTPLVRSRPFYCRYREKNIWMFGSLFSYLFKHLIVRFWLLQTVYVSKPTSGHYSYGYDSKKNHYYRQLTSLAPEGVNVGMTLMVPWYLQVPQVEDPLTTSSQSLSSLWKVMFLYWKSRNLQHAHSKLKDLYNVFGISM